MSEEEILKQLNSLISEKRYYTEYHAWVGTKTFEAIQGLLNLYNKEKEITKKLGKNILEDNSYLVLKRLKIKLQYDINKINEKILSEEYINDYRIARLKGMRTKCKELLELLEERKDNG